MDSLIESKIKKIISYIARHPGEDVSHVVDNQLTGNTEVSMPKDIIVPELLKLPPSKRTLLINIIRKKTNYNLCSSDDYNKNYVRFKEVGEVIREVPHFAKKIKWFFQ